MFVPTRVANEWNARIKEFTIWNQLTGTDEFKKSVIAQYIRAFHEYQGVPNLPIEFSVLVLLDLKFDKIHLVFVLKGNKTIKILAPY